MWPQRAGAFLDCRNGGWHKLYKPHRLERNSRRYLQTCRYCDYAVIMEFNEEKGRIEEHVYKPTRFDDNVL